MNQNKKTVIIDLWVLLALVLLLGMSGLMDYELSETELQLVEENKGEISSVVATAIGIMSTFALITIVCGISIILLYLYRCGRIKRYRYLVLYAECKRMTPLMSILRIVLVALVFVLISVIAILVYMTWHCDILSIAVALFKTIVLIYVSMLLSVHTTDEEIYK